jgi:hypothetical protein
MGRIRAWLGQLLAAVPAEEVGGLRLEGPSWEVADHSVDPAQFFRALPTLLVDGCFLLIEGGAHPAPLRGFLERSAVAPAAKIARGTSWPRATLFHIPAAPSALFELAALAEQCASPEIGDHLHVYTRQRILLQWYDAFSAPFYVSKSLPPDRAEAFCRALNASFKDAGETGA